MFRKIKGQNSVLHILNQAINNNRIAQAYLFHGIDGVGKFTTALYFGMALNCLSKSEFRPCGVCVSCRKFLALDHPDLIYVFPSANLELSPDGEIKKQESLRQYREFIQNRIERPWQDYYFSSNAEIRRESIAYMIRRLDLSAFEAQYRICIVEDADGMNNATANAFLKTLEEPPQNTVIILTTHRLSMLLPTILSRCQPVAFHPVAPRVMESVLTDQFNIPAEQARTVSRIADGSVKRAISMAQNETSELRDLAFSLVQLCSEGNDLAAFRLLRNPPLKLSAEAAVELLRYVSLFVSDLAVALSDPEQLVNIDKQDFLLRSASQMLETPESAPADRVYYFLREMGDLTRRINGNANLQLALVNSGVMLRKVFTG